LSKIAQSQFDRVSNQIFPFSELKKR
jgi:lysyl-tRNA synthetase class 2